MERFISAAYKNKHADNNHARTHSCFQKNKRKQTNNKKQENSKMLIGRVKY